MKTRVIYLMSWPAHTPYLVVSLMTLRRWWHGEVAVCAWPASQPIVDRIAEDVRLQIKSRHREPAYYGKNDQFLDKQKLVMGMDDDAVLYLDADTTVHGQLDGLIGRAESYSFVATQWNDWRSGSHTIAGRLNTLREVSGIDKVLIDRTIERNYPSVNGGVWAARPSSPVLPMWHDWTWLAKRTFIADEKVLHVLQPRFCPTGEMATVGADGVYNSSPNFRSAKLRDEDVVVWHYHGDCATRPDKSPKGYAMWWPLWQEALRLNLGGCQEWYPQTKNKFMLKLDQEGARCPETIG